VKDMIAAKRAAMKNKLVNVYIYWEIDNFRLSIQMFLKLSLLMETRLWFYTV
jgi:hypothetical protein